MSPTTERILKKHSEKVTRRLKAILEPHIMTVITPERIAAIKFQINAFLCEYDAVNRILSGNIHFKVDLIQSEDGGSLVMIPENIETATILGMECKEDEILTLLRNADIKE